MYHMEESGNNDDSDSSSSSNRSSRSGSISNGSRNGRGPRVVIVGAGYAGVAAAGVLRAGGITDITVLEAQGRPGGRVQTLQLEEGHLEIGAQFLHGQNEIYKIAESNNNLLDEEDEEEAEDLPDTVLQYHEYDFYLPGGRLVDSHVILENLRALEDLYGKATYAQSPKTTLDVNVSLGEFFRAHYGHVLSTTPGEKELKSSLLKWFDNWAKMDSAGSVDQLSLPGMVQYVYVPGSGVQETRTGMEDVFKCLLHLSLSMENLRLNKPVKKIHWSDKMADSLEACADLGEVTSAFERTKMGMDSGDEIISGERTGTGSSEFSKESGDEVTGLSAPREPQGTERGSYRTKAGEMTCQGDEAQTEAVTIDPGENTSLKSVGPLNATAPSTQLSGRRWGAKWSQDENKPTDQVVVEITSAPRTKSVLPKEHESFKQGFGGGDGYRVRIECEDGEIIHADHVIVTSSIGFLKDNEDFFKPQLPRNHRKAVNSMGFGNVAKVFLVWDLGEETNCGVGVDPLAEWQKSILGVDVWGAVFLWPEGDGPQLKSAVTTSRTTSTGRQWYEDVSLWEVPSGHDTCVVAWIGGEAATVMESVPEEEVKEVLFEMLRLFLNKPHIPPPSRVIRSMWHSNPYIRGAYSYLATGFPLELHEVLSQPVPSVEDPVLQLAGEACSKNFYSTAHGALESGSLAARALLRHYGLLNE